MKGKLSGSALEDAKIDNQLKKEGPLLNEGPFLLELPCRVQQIQAMRCGICQVAAQDILCSCGKEYIVIIVYGVGKVAPDARRP